MNDLDSKFIKELSKIMPSDFKDWFQNDPEELPVVTRIIIEDLRKENKMLWEMLDNANKQNEH